MRRAAAWAVAAPILVAGSWAAHVIAYRIEIPNAGARAAVLQATGHGYADWIPVLVAVGWVIALGLVVQARGQLVRGAVRPSLWPFLLAPAAAFAVQEHLERYAATGDIPWSAATERTFLPGLRLQLPFGVLAYLLARLVLGAARRLALWLSASADEVIDALRVAACAVALDPPRRRVLAWSLAGRGPPLLSS
jgi:hypothetical protein